MACEYGPTSGFRLVLPIPAPWFVGALTDVVARPSLRRSPSWVLACKLGLLIDLVPQLNDLDIETWGLRHRSRGEAHVESFVRQQRNLTTDENMKALYA